MTSFWHTLIAVVLLTLSSLSALPAMAAPPSPAAATASKAQIFRYVPQALTGKLVVHLPQVVHFDTFHTTKVPGGYRANFSVRVPLVALAGLLPYERGWVIHQALPGAKVLDKAATDPFWREESGQLNFGEQLALTPDSPPVATPIRPIARVVPGQGIRLYFGWRAHKKMLAMKDLYDGTFSCLVVFRPTSGQQGIVTITEPTMHYAASGLEGALGGPVIRWLEGQYGLAIGQELNKGINEALVGLLGNQALGLGGQAMGLLGQQLTWKAADVRGTDLLLQGQWSFRGR